MDEMSSPCHIVNKKSHLGHVTMLKLRLGIETTTGARI